jgi:anionic cell wall polymer biosynthesis LytR-Cps2A-Psr (LCP) family protein
VLPSGEASVSEVFCKESLSVLAASFASRNINIKKYVHVTEDNLRRMLSNLGSTRVEVTGNYEFNIDAVKYTFTPGEQNIAPDTLIKYMKYAETGESALRLQANTAAAVFRQHFTKENLDKCESFFSTLINLVDTNITAFDYNGALPVLTALLSGEVEIAVVS